MKTNQIMMKTGLAVMLLALVAGCAGILDGPFRADGRVPELLYANNSSGYVTFWDDETNAYRTYDQMNGVFLAKPLFTASDAREANSSGMHAASGMYAGNSYSQNYRVAGPVIVPLTDLDEEGLRIQAEQGCFACHFL